VNKSHSIFRLIIVLSIILFIGTIKVFAAFPSDFWPQAGQTSEWTTNSSNELCFNGNQPGFGPATVATTFGGLVSNDYTGITLKFDAIISSGGENTTVVLSSNGTWGSKGIVIELNRFQIQCVNNYNYPGTVLSSDAPTYQNTVVKPGLYNSFIINVSATGEITTTVNGYTCPTTYNASLSVLQASTPSPRFAYISAGFSGFKLRNLKVEKSNLTKQYFSTYASLSGTYYIDAINGSDMSSGLSDGEAWRSFDNVNKTTLNAGTKILLKKGCTWNQRLEIRGSGTISNWIELDSYGTNSNKPKISLTNNVNDIGVLICDLDKTSGSVKSQPISYIKIQNLEIANTRLGIYYRSITGTTNTGFKVNNVTFNNINCDPVMTAVNSAPDKNAEITTQLFAVKGNLETIGGSSDGGVREYIFPAGIFIGGKTLANQTISGNHTTVLSELEVSNCDFNEAIAGVMSVFYWPVVSSDGANIWQKVVSKVKITNITSTGIVNGVIGLDCVNGGAVADANGVMHPDPNGWGVFKNVNVTMGSAVPGRTWPNGTTGVILSNCRNMLVDSCEFSNMLNQNNPDGCGFDFETHNNQVTIQNTKFINNDGHSILLMNGGGYGGNSNIIIQKSLFAKNLKNSSSPNEFYFSQNSDGHSNVKVINNQVFMRRKNKDNINLNFFPNRTYLTSTNNDLYYLDDTKPEITISFLSQPYTFKADVFSVIAPQVSKLLLKNGDLISISRSIPIYNEYSMTFGTPASYMVSEDPSFAGAIWNTYTPNFNYELSAGDGGKIVYFKLKNVSGTSPNFSSAITLNQSVMPVSLIKYEANKKSNGILLNWETASEVNSSNYIIYKSTDGSNFEEIGKIIASGKASNYQYIDKSAVFGINYYKLVQVDLNGKSVVLGVKSVNFELKTDNEVSIYPNPAYQSINLNFDNSFSNTIYIKLFDLNGKELQEASIPSQKHFINYVLEFNNKVTTGVYFIRITSGNYSHIEKIILK
jgi:hypothetical protein